MKEFRNYFETFFSFGVLGILLLILVPLTPFLLDFLLSFSFLISVITLLLAIYVSNIRDFSSFPSLLLILAFFRLGLNIASSRMILSKADVGQVISSLGQFVAGENLVIGFFLFVFLMLINFIVITKGAGRIAEVSARFILESLPGKQMAIDGALNSHSVSFEEANNLRKQIQQEADFYGAMDGASKFVRGEAIAALLITCLNLLGCLILGFSSENNYLQLTIGDALSAQIPCLIVSLAAGILLTKSGDDSIVKTLPKQLFQEPKAFLLSGCFLMALGFIPGMPKIILIGLGSALLFYYFANKKDSTKGLEVITGQSDKNWGELFPFLTFTESPETGYIVREKGLEIFKGDEISFENFIYQKVSELINRQYVADKLTLLRTSDAALVTELFSKKIGYGLILKVLQNLLREKVPIYDFQTIISEIVDQESLKKPDLISEAVRKKLLPKSLKVLHAITLDPEIEEMVSLSSENPLRPKMVNNIEHALETLISKNKQVRPVILTNSKTRPILSRLLKNQSIPVLAFSELNEEATIHSIGIISNEDLI